MRSPQVSLSFADAIKKVALGRLGVRPKSGSLKHETLKTLLFTDAAFVSQSSTEFRQAWNAYQGRAEVWTRQRWLATGLSING